MRGVRQPWIFLVTALVLAGALAGIAAAAVPDYSVTYVVTVADDGSALWRVEYRTLLLTDADAADFASYSRDLPSVYLPQFRELMERSAAQAAVATGRHMEITGVTGDAVVQESPTGKYGVVLFTARWDGFARPGSPLIIGDAFGGGLYLEKDNALVIRYPAGYSVSQAEPAPDDTRDGLTWYGQRSFGAGEPRIVLEQPAFPVLPAAAGLVIVIIIIAFAGFLIIRRRGKSRENEPAGPAATAMTGTELLSLEDRITELLRSRGGELFQSEIVRSIGLPKSTVSAGLNGLHARGTIIKIRKGRENLIRLSPEPREKAED